MVARIPSLLGSRFTIQDFIFLPLHKLYANSHSISVIFVLYILIGVQNYTCHKTEHKSYGFAMGCGQKLLEEHFQSSYEFHFFYWITF